MEGLVAQGLVKWFKSRKVVDNVSLDIQRGEVVGLLGPNGAGKTTSFYMMVGLLPTDGGRIFLEGEEISRLPMYQRCRMGVGYLPQESSVFRKLTVEENLLAILETLELTRGERRQRARELLAELGLTALAAYPAYTLSGGERRRLEITRALVTDPQYLLLDEPFTGIDPIAIEAIQLLQLSTLELQEVVQKELLENPLLEEMPVDGAETPDAGEATPSAEATPAPTVEPITVDPPPTAERQTDDLPFDPISVMFDEPEERSLVAQEEREDLPFENMVRSVSSLADHLEEHLRFVTEDPAARRIGAEIIGNLDEDGCLRAELEEIAQRCAATPEEVERVLTEMIQKFDPIGVGARTISECLLLQLRSNPPVDPVSVEIVERHFEDLSRRRYADIARALKLSADRIMESVEEIMALEPKPGRRFGGNDSRYIVPDVSVYKLGSDYTVVLNEEGIPRLRVNSLYRSLLRSSGDEARQYVEQKLRSALWLIKSVDQRQRPLRTVTQSIVKFQREFLDKGLPYLRPLSLRDVGEDISMHESTISRVTTNKYVETPQGLFELKFFFHSGIASGDGEMVSSVSVKKMIQDLLGNEDATKPLSDQEVAGILKGRGLTIARRTVAKYREELGILPSHQRRLQPRKR